MTGAPPWSADWTHTEAARSRPCGSASGTRGLDDDSRLPGRSPGGRPVRPRRRPRGPGGGGGGGRGVGGGWATRTAPEGGRLAAPAFPVPRLPAVATAFHGAPSLFTP